MTEETELLATLEERGIELTPDGDQIHYRAPRGALTHELREAIRLHKPRLLALLHPAVDAPPVAAPPCSICGDDEFWERPPAHGGGRVCARCHPDPRDLLAHWEERAERASVPHALDPGRARLLAWASTRAAPSCASARGWRSWGARRAGRPSS